VLATVLVDIQDQLLQREFDRVVEFTCERPVCAFSIGTRCLYQWPEISSVSRLFCIDVSVIGCRGRSLNVVRVCVQAQETAIRSESQEGGRGVTEGYTLLYASGYSTEPYVALSQVRSTIWVYTLREQFCGGGEDGSSFQGRCSGPQYHENMLGRRNATQLSRRGTRWSAQPVIRCPWHPVLLYPYGAADAND
jgi:hypothetical protein